MRAGWKHHGIQTKLTRRFLPKEIPFFTSTLGGLHFPPLFLRPLKCFWIWGWTSCLPRQKASWNGICLPSQTGGQAITERALPGCWPLWLHSTVTAQRQATSLTLWPHNLEAHIGSPGRWQLRSVGVECHWQTKGSMLLCVTCVWEEEETSGTAWLRNQNMAAPIIRVLAFLPVFQGGPGLRKGILAFSDCTHDFICPSALIICTRSWFHKPFSCETRLVTRVNYSVVKGNMMMEEKIDFWKPGSRGSQNITLLHEESTQPFDYSLWTQGNYHDLNSLHIKSTLFLAMASGPYLSSQRKCNWNPVKKAPRSSALLPSGGSPKSLLVRWWNYHFQKEKEGGSGFTKAGSKNLWVLNAASLTTTQTALIEKKFGPNLLLLPFILPLRAHVNSKFGLVSWGLCGPISFLSSSLLMLIWQFRREETNGTLGWPLQHTKIFPLIPDSAVILCI